VILDLDTVVALDWLRGRLYIAIWVGNRQHAGHILESAGTAGHLSCSTATVLEATLDSVIGQNALEQADSQEILGPTIIVSKTDSTAAQDGMRSERKMQNAAAASTMKRGEPCLKAGPQMSWPVILESTWTCPGTSFASACGEVGGWVG
jgi:hypothetical protein